MKDTPPTAKQIRYLHLLGYTGPIPFTKWETSVLITEWRKRPRVNKRSHNRGVTFRTGRQPR